MLVLRHLRHLAATAWPLLVLAPCACTQGCHDFPDQKQRVSDLRVLAIRFDPPEVVLPALASGDPDATTEVQLTALVVDPRGGLVRLAWSGCPQTGELGCADPDWLAGELGWEEGCFLLTQGLVPAALPPPFRPLFERQANAAAFAAFAAPLAPPLEVAAPASPPHRLPLAPLPVTVSSRLLYALMAQDLTCGLASVWPQAQLTAANLDTGDQPLTAHKRLVAGWGDLRPLALMLGVPLCPPTIGDGASEPPGAETTCYDLPAYRPNQHPRLAQTRWRPGAAAVAGADFAPVPADGVPVAAGASVRIQPSFADGSSEEYGRFAFDIQTQALTPVRYREQLSIAWFVTAGQVAEDITWALVTVGYDTAYTAPTAAQLAAQGGDDPATVDCAELRASFPRRLPLYLVGRDDRGGVDWRVETLAIGPPAAAAGWGPALARCAE